MFLLGHRRIDIDDRRLHKTNKNNWKLIKMQCFLVKYNSTEEQFLRHYTNRYPILMRNSGVAIGTSCVCMSKKRSSFVKSGTYIKAAGVDPPEPNNPPPYVVMSTGCHSMLTWNLILLSPPIQFCMSMSSCLHRSTRRYRMYILSSIPMIFFLQPTSWKIRTMLRPVKSSVFSQSQPKWWLLSQIRFSLIMPSTCYILHNIVYSGVSNGFSQ